MARLVFIALLAFVCCWSHAQVTQYAPDIRTDAGVTTTLGFANPIRDEITVTVTGYGADGTVLGEQAVTLPGFGRYEAKADELFGASVAWAKVDSPVFLAGFVHYAQQNGHMSLMPMTHLSGEQMYVSQIESAKEHCKQDIVLANVSGNAGEVLSQPVKQRWKFDQVPKLEAEPFVVPGLGGAFASGSYDYSAQAKDDTTLFWDKLTTTNDVALTGAQHLEVCADTGSHFASMELPRTSNRSMVFAAAHPLRDDYFTKVVLVNTYPVPLDIEIQTLFEPRTEIYFEATSVVFNETLEPYEKREITLTGPTHLEELPVNPRWMVVTPFEGGLVGYQITGSDDGQHLAASSAMGVPSTVSMLPHTPSNDTVETEIGIVNYTDKRDPIYVIGFDNAGRKVAKRYDLYLDAHENMVFTTDELFGERAKDVAWVRVGAHTLNVGSYGLVRNRTGGQIALMFGHSFVDQTGEIFFADFEFFDIDLMRSQEWTEYWFDDLVMGDPNQDGTVPVSYVRRSELDAFGTLYNNKAGQVGFHVQEAVRTNGLFFTELVLPAKTGFSYLGYEPLFKGTRDPYRDARTDSVAFLSPFFEVPPGGDYYLNFDMRFINPHQAEPRSRFGMVWREEGSTTWRFHGLQGILLLDPPVIVSDCWIDIFYRCRDATLSNWLKHENRIPIRANGKRIQVGFFYHQQNEGSIFGGPLMYIDNVHLSAVPDPAAVNFGIYAEQVFEFNPPTDDTEKDEELSEEP